MEIRRNAIIELINTHGTVKFSQIKKAFPNVSDMTLRTDLKALDDANQIIRIHGGAKSVQVVVGTDDFLNKRSFRNRKEKQMIAEKALSLLRPDTTIFLDSGSTATILASLFPDQSNLIYTSGLSCAIELSGLSKPTVMIPGGKLNRYSQSVNGYSALKEIERVNFDQVFLGVTYYSSTAGFTCGSDDESFIKSTAMHQSDQVIVLMDSSKVGKKCSYKICDISDVDLIISDGKLSEDFLEECQKNQVIVL